MTSKQEGKPRKGDPRVRGPNIGNGKRECPGKQQRDVQDDVHTAGLESKKFRLKNRDRGLQEIMSPRKRNEKKHMLATSYFYKRVQE